jgi:hypothetical protein
LKITVFTANAKKQYVFNIKPGSWSFVFFLSEIKYEISPKVTKSPEIDQATRFKLTTLFSAKLGQI